MFTNSRWPNHFVHQSIVETPGEGEIKGIGLVKGGHSSNGQNGLVGKQGEIDGNETCRRQPLQQRCDLRKATIRTEYDRFVSDAP